MKIFRFSTLFSGVGGLLIFTACGNNQPTPTAQSSPPAQAPLPVPTAPTTPTAGISALQSVISKTTTAVNAKDFAKAKKEFDQFEKNWETVEDGIRQKSPSTYQAIEADMEKVEEALKSSNQQKSLTALQGLNQQVSESTKS